MQTFAHLLGACGLIYTKCYVTVVMSYDNIAYHYSDIALVEMNHVAVATVQEGQK